MIDPFSGSGRAGDLLQLVREARKLLGEAGEGEGPLQCPKCERPAPLDGTFCIGCGHRLRLPCPRCKALTVSGMAYCSACGVELSAQVVDAEIEALAREAEERRLKEERNLLRRYQATTVLESGRVRHLLGTRKDDGLKEFVKVASSKAGRRLLENEVKALEAIGEHPGVIRLQEHRDQEDELVAVFEHVPSRSIRFPVAIPRLLEIVSSTLETLVHVHGQGIVHADLKPAHLMFRADDTPVLVDWNIAQEPGPSKFSAFTPMFAAPEQIVGDRVDFGADVYAVGVILYLLFTHDRFPAVLEESAEPEPMLQVLQAKKAMNRAYLSKATVYKGKLASLQQQVQSVGPAQGGALEERRVLGAKYLFSSELSRTQDVNAEIRLTGEVLAVVQRATQVDPADRYPSAAAMKEAVDAILARVAPAEGGEA